ncbi:MULTISPECIES: D-alanyl-lipoteichoic acid biosynthesis protein DltD [Bacillus amyloliquefaciens group]|jgi:D-alanine transfer protein|uniref:D-alanyl-lipoteichoic acid biosynthesis protein DltD n=1 Tax=Bacillus amyloliquefaciens group TaxID=1938374 RepID=UPI00102E8C92|nr:MULTISPECIES: D-alanyl-lipoteichoic acid biosynthesis protein DltD [Bacillus amyloliquefaciens group]MDQ8057328.1 D-alanyl-lipoteichoic acid biosynthesis protein DltD [Bacillus velezensis]NUI22535.1 D-alanyl-lipoteichoic acid biosynthesis protein DltD [Bacillus amyloliquefaciens]NUI31740.1 D-alanyl-lipoteichoic acid biosynthesis protein DltD [Bacillus amyloliquefaciens]NUI35228.1 D-alanyl-lipoteichoic acid biosynthesis protein DltD [Bacillus amyloliquefaciens]NUI69076.1 D-alanyl-lipoteichoi
MKKRFFGPIILAFVLFVGAIAVPASWLTRFIPEKRVEESAAALNPNMFQGLYLQNKMFEDSKYMPIFGSSELSRLDEFHPSNYFQVNNQGFTPYLVGKGGDQSLIHAVNFAAHYQQLKGKKLVFIVSPQWFIKKGSDEQHFAPNFSSLQALDLAFNNQIDPAVKKNMMKRMLRFKVVQHDAVLSELYKGMVNGQSWKVKAVMPAAKAYYSLLEKKDLYYSMGETKGPERTISENLKGKSWSELKTAAAQLGERSSKSNPFYIDDASYKKIKKKVKRVKGINKGRTYAKSVEYHDFADMLDILKDAGAEPMFVVIPVNGKWYDYTGFPKKGRTDYYKKVTKQIKAKGFQVADLSGHEYDPYFMKDTIHIAWKGWVYVDKAMEQFYKTGKVTVH